jgi:hypothetical protein
VGGISGGIRFGGAGISSCRETLQFVSRQLINHYFEGIFNRQGADLQVGRALYCRQMSVFDHAGKHPVLFTFATTLVNS